MHRHPLRPAIFGRFRVGQSQGAGGSGAPELEQILATAPRARSAFELFRVGAVLRRRTDTAPPIVAPPGQGPTTTPPPGTVEATLPDGTTVPIDVISVRPTPDGPVIVIADPPVTLPPGTVIGPTPDAPVQWPPITVPTEIPSSSGLEAIPLAVRARSAFERFAVAAVRLASGADVITNQGAPVVTSDGRPVTYAGS